MNVHAVRLGKFGFSACILSYSLLLLLMPMKAAGQTGFGTVKIVVTGPGGTPISNADLCLAMPGQSARKMTDSSGVYTTTLPVGTTTIRVFKSGYANAQITVTMTNGANLGDQTIPLQPGQGTPVPADCGSIVGTTTPGNSCNVINNHAMADTTTNRALSIVVGFDVRPAYYRVTEFSAAERYPESQFDPDQAFKKKNVPWQPVTSPILYVDFTLTEPGYGTHHVYIQTQRYQSGCISSSRVVSVILAPADVQTYTLIGADLSRFVAESKLRGYQFTHQFRFSKKEDFWKMCGPNEMHEPLDPIRAQRPASVKKVAESIEADFEMFSGPDLNPFWEFVGARAFHPDLPPVQDGEFLAGDGNVSGTPVLEFKKYSDITCPYCTAQDMKNLHRHIGWTRWVWDMGVPGPLDQLVDQYDARSICKPRSGKDPYLIRLTIRGPAGEDPINALGDLRVTKPPQFRLIPPPNKILPRGIDESGGREGTEENETVDKATESDVTP